MGVRYIGSKARIADAIVDLAGKPGNGRFVDAFCGTGSVAQAAAARGWRIALNDSMPSAVAMSTAAVMGTGNISFDALGGYQRVCRRLDLLPATPGFLTQEYSPESARLGGVERRYFTAANAGRVDAMRAQISEWQNTGLLTVNEERLLIADLISAANRVANISGTYGCFLSTWSAGATRSVEVTPRVLPERATDFMATIGDVFDVPTTTDDVVYYDPPYTKRQYAAYYHMLETIAAGDAPAVGGVTGLRPWRDKASDFCYKTRALDALTRLVLRTRAKTVLLSYSDEGHVPREQLLAALTEAGSVTMHEINRIGRYRPNSGAAEAGDTVAEYVIEVAPLDDRADTEDDLEMADAREER